MGAREKGDCGSKRARHSLSISMAKELEKNDRDGRWGGRRSANLENSERWTVGRTDRSFFSFLYSKETKGERGQAGGFWTGSF